jgi:dTDP-4-dehydrorhamnose reductase
METSDHRTDPVRPPLDIWGGIECTVVRVGDDFRDEVAETGHLHRLDDLDQIAALGIRTLRYPVLWETIAPVDPDRCDWSWHDARLVRLSTLGISPIAGLVHHGSGPRYTSLVDPGFAEGLARHARRVAERYPWIEAFTPVNEPLTTARFSGLYGHWYPHGRDQRTFLRALVNQCRATLLAMRAIRAVTPKARLVQTEDLGKSFARPRLAYQAEYENERRWLSFDLLCGRVDDTHPWWSRFLEAGVTAEDLREFLTGEATPDIFGVNHYLTSDRYLDDRVERYPDWCRGGNGRHRYADVEAVRLRLAPGLVGPRARLEEIWERYRKPVAITEAHHGCTRDEQLRWLKEIWDAAEDCREAGADIRAVTVWSMFGAVDWNSLLTRKTGFYEPGAFDSRGPSPRPTAIAGAVRSLATTGGFDHPVLDAPGWWRRSARHYGPPREHRRVRGPARRVLIAGSGRLARGFARICDVRGLAYTMLSRAQLDLADPAAVRRVIETLKPWAVVNCIGYSNIRGAEDEPDRCFRENVTGVSVLASACAPCGIPLVSLSSDQVFDGLQNEPYVESDPVSPDGVFGASKAEAERRLLKAGVDGLILRTGPIFGPWSGEDFLARSLQRLARGDRLEISTADVISPGYVPDLAHAALDLLIDGETGIWHLSNPGSITSFDMLLQLASGFGLDESRLVPIEAGQGRHRALRSERTALLPPLENALGRYRHDARMLVHDFMA